MSVSAIARQLEMSRNTVRKYLRGSVLPDRRIGSKRGSKLDPYLWKIEELMGMGIYNSVVIHEHIAVLGYAGGRSILKAYLKPLRPPTQAEGPAIRRYETPPGSQVQMDWGICKYTDPRGRTRRMVCFVMVLGYSRVRYIEFCRRCDRSSLLRCIVNAFRYFGGVPEQLLTDRMKTVVLHTEMKKAVWQRDFERFAEELGFIPKLCRVARPQTKGKVERLVHYVKDNFIPGRKFTDVFDLNNQAVSWMAHVNSQVHGSTGEIPVHMLAEEKLRPFPVDGRHEAYTWEERRVSRDGFVSFDGVNDGVNWRYSGDMLRVKVIEGRVYLADFAGEVVQDHPLYRSGRKYVFAKGQYDGLPAANGRTSAPAFAIQIRKDDVQIRDLNSYAAMAGGF